MLSGAAGGGCCKLTLTVSIIPWDGVAGLCMFGCVQTYDTAPLTGALLLVMKLCCAGFCGGG